MSGVKLPGQKPMSRDLDCQAAEPQTRIAILNRLAALGIPVTEPAGQLRPGKEAARPPTAPGNKAAHGETLSKHLACGAAEWATRIRSTNRSIPAFASMEIDVSLCGGIQIDHWRGRMDFGGANRINASTRPILL